MSTYSIVNMSPQSQSEWAEAVLVLTEVALLYDKLYTANVK